MKKIIPLFAFTFILHLALHAAVPVQWTVETTRAQPATFDAYQGETLELEATLTSRGKPLELSGIAALYWQTNGMGSAYWETTAAVNSNRLSAVWTPEMDVGAKVYNCFIGQPGTIYHAAFQLRLRPSPGATPNVLPLPVPVIDFAKVRVLNPPWSGGGGGGVNTNAVIDIIHETVDGAARPLPKYLHIYNADDSYPDAAAEYYRSRGNGKTDGGCSSVRDGGFLSRNFDYPFDDRAEFVVKMSAGPGRFASVGVAQVGTNFTEQMVTSGKPEYSRLYKWLPCATVDGINEIGVACNINVVGGDPQTSGWHNDTGDLHPLAAIRWILDNSTNAQSAAEYIAEHIAFPSGWTQNFHYMICDEESTYIVENGEAVPYGNTFVVMTNHGMFNPPAPGPGIERDVVLRDGANITNAWYTKAYSPDTSWLSDFNGSETLMATSKVLWAQKPKEAHRGESVDGYTWWQTVHTSVYDLANRVLRVAVQEVDDWYTFQVSSSGAKVDAYTKAETDELLAGKADKNGDAAENFNVQDLDVSGDVTIVGETRLTGGITGDVIINGGIEVGGVVAASVSDNDGNNLADKADRAESGHADELATLDEDGNPTSSGIAKDDVITTDGGTVDGDLEVKGNAEIANLIVRDTVESLTVNSLTISNKDPVDLTTEDGVLADTNGKYAHLSKISATDPTFSNEVATVARTVTPQPSPTLRIYDEVLQCWWIGKMVNGVMQWEVE